MTPRVKWVLQGALQDKLLLTSERLLSTHLATTQYASSLIDLATQPFVFTDRMSEWRTQEWEWMLSSTVCWQASLSLASLPTRGDLEVARDPEHFPRSTSEIGRRPDGRRRRGTTTNMENGQNTRRGGWHFYFSGWSYSIILLLWCQPLGCHTCQRSWSSLRHLKHVRRSTTRMILRLDFTTFGTKIFKILVFLSAYYS